MRIKATCSRCHRDLLLGQLVEGARITSRCPWCGHLLAPHYTSLFADAIRRTEGAGYELTRALGHLRDLERPNGDQVRFRIRPESILDPLQELLGAEEVPKQHPRLRRAA
jgi:hypothetical protein